MHYSALHCKNAQKCIICILHCIIVHFAVDYSAFLQCIIVHFAVYYSAFLQCIILYFAVYYSAFCSVFCMCGTTSAVLRGTTSAVLRYSRSSLLVLRFWRHPHTILPHALAHSVLSSTLLISLSALALLGKKKIETERIRRTDKKGH